MQKVEDWFSYVPLLKMDGFRPSGKSLAQRLHEFWLPDETILYIGMTNGTIQQRLQQFYDHHLGDKRPHRGGHWIKTSDSSIRVFVYWTPVAAVKTDDTKKMLLEIFMRNVSEQKRLLLRDPILPLPFANLELTAGMRKKHGIEYQVIR